MCSRIGAGTDYSLLLGGDREILFSPVQLTTSSIGNFTRLIHILLYVICDDHTIHTYCKTQFESLRRQRAVQERNSWETELRRFPGVLQTIGGHVLATALPATNRRRRFRAQLGSTRFFSSETPSTSLHHEYSADIRWDPPLTAT